MSRFANLSKESNDGFQMYSRRPQRYQNRFQERIQLPPKEEKIITAEKFPELSDKVIVKKELPMLNYIEKAKIIPQAEEKKEIVKEEIKPIKDVLFTQEEAQQVFENLVTNWKNYEDEYIEEYGDDEYLKTFGNYLFSYEESDEESEGNEENLEDWEEIE